MIRLLELRRWRAFDKITLDLAPGTTFLVAPNGVGKTSLLLGLTWALFGENSKVNAKDCVRLGYDSAEATITLSLRDRTSLVIHRTVTVAGKTTVTYSQDDRTVDSDEAQQMLTEEFGAPLDVAARLSIIRGSGKEDGELDLREHLYDAFGVSELRKAAAVATQLHKEAVTARKALRSESRAVLANREQLSQQAAALSSNLDDLTVERAQLVERRRSAQQDQHTVAAWAAHRDALTEQARRVEELLTSAATDGVPAESLDDLATQVRARSEAVETTSHRARELLTEAQAQQLAARSALTLLEGHDPECPTCARPFHGDELERSIAAQRASLAAAESRIQETQQELSQAGSELDRFSQLEAAIGELMVPVPTPDAPMPPEDPDVLLTAVEEELRQHDERAGALSRERATILDQIQGDDAVRTAVAAEQFAWRREALAQATAEALASAAKRIANEHIDPLSQQIRWRWKALFGEDGLQLRADGAIVRVVGDRELSWDQLSSGEQIWARLVASLLILQSSTTLPFAWLDEPLEHLDPRARRIVATDLATSTRSGRPAQLIVTTYEHDIARQLSEDVESASIRHINRTELTTRPPAPRGRATSTEPDEQADRGSAISQDDYDEDEGDVGYLSESA